MPSYYHNVAIAPDVSTNITGCQLSQDLTELERCQFVKMNDPLCEGGGYILYTVIVMCQPTLVNLIFAVVGFTIMLFYYFIAMSTSADGFLSPNIVAIVDHLKLSQNIAGVTLLAFANGAPDVFASLAAVIGSKSPKAGLAYGALLGAGIFDTTVVVATIVLIKPFHVMRRPIIRDIGVYFIAIVWVLITFVTAPWILWWETIVFLFIYVVYALVVIIGRVVHQRRRRAINDEKQQQQRSIESQLQRKQSKATLDTEKTIDDNDDITLSSKPTISTDKKLSIANGQSLFTVESLPQLGEIVNSNEDDNEPTHWHYDESIISVPSNLSSESCMSQDTMTTITELINPPSAIKKDISKEIKTRIRREIKHFLSAIKPISRTKWISVNIFMRIFYTIRAPIVVAMKLTIPLAKNQWSKLLAIFHCYSCPLFIVFATQQMVTSPVPGWTIALAIGVLPSLAIAIITESKKEPKYFRIISGYIGFVMSIAWIYLLSNEIVGVLTMIGVVTGISQLILGLTLLAWSNCLGDFVADTAVARRGFPCIGISAAFGGPLFNLLIGFGVPFTIATVRDGPIDIIFDPVSKILLIFLAASLISSIILLPMQRFYVRRPYAIYLIALYLLFFVIVILASVRIIDF